MPVPVLTIVHLPLTPVPSLTNILQFPHRIPCPFSALTYALSCLDSFGLPEGAETTASIILSLDELINFTDHFVYFFTTNLNVA